MTERLYYTDSYLTSFEAQVREVRSGNHVLLDRSAFYPTSGGQPHDLGYIGDARVLDVIDEGDEVIHVVENGSGLVSMVQCEVDWERRFDYMQQHTGQHLISAVLERDFGLRTESVYFKDEISGIELSGPPVTSAMLADMSQRVNRAIWSNAAVSVTFEESPQDLRKASQREGELRIVTIAGIDRSACGGTHVRETAEIGVALLRGMEKVRSNTRIEFLCGHRAVRTALADYQTLSGLARHLTVGIPQVFETVTAQAERLKQAEKSLQRVEQEMATAQARDLLSTVVPDASGRRVLVRADVPIDSLWTALSRLVPEQPSSLLLMSARTPCTVVLAASRDSGVHAGNVLKSVLAAYAGRGGGSATLAQGSVPDAEKLDAVLSDLRQQLAI